MGQGVLGQPGIRRVGDRPAHDPAGEQVHHHGEIAPTAISPDVGDVATPDLVGLADSELAVEPIRHVGLFLPGLFVRRTTRLPTDKIGLPHQPPDLEATDRHAIGCKAGSKRSAASRTTALGKVPASLGSKRKPVGIHAMTLAFSIVVVA